MVIFKLKITIEKEVEGTNIFQISIIVYYYF